MTAGLLASHHRESEFEPRGNPNRDSVRSVIALVLEDRFAINFRHGDHTSDAVPIMDRAVELMQACRVRIFDMSGFVANVVFEFGMAKGAKLPNVYAMRRSTVFRSNAMPTMMNNIDCPIYSNAKELERLLHRALERHFWPTDSAFTETKLDWLAAQIRQLTYPGCETDKSELAQATGIADSFVTQAVKKFFVETGDARALNVGPTPRYRFDYTSVRPVPSSGDGAASLG